MIVKTAVIVVAAGKGSRMNSNKNKQFLELDGVPVLARTLLTFQKCDSIDEIIVVMNEELMEECKLEILNKYGITKCKQIVKGGKERGDSVRNGLSAVSEDVDIISVHDGARPFITEEIIKRSIMDANRFGASCVGVKSKDTIKIGDMEGFVTSTPDRAALWNVQTPQSFKKDLLIKAYKTAQEAGYSGTDDSSLVEWAGYKVKLTEGSYENIKITTIEDMAIGEAILLNR